MFLLVPQKDTVLPRELLLQLVVSGLEVVYLHLLRQLHLQQKVLYETHPNNSPIQQVQHVQQLAVDLIIKTKKCINGLQEHQKVTEDISILELVITDALTMGFQLILLKLHLVDENLFLYSIHM